MPPISTIPLSLASLASSAGSSGLASPLEALAAQVQAETVFVPQFAYSANLDEKTWRAIDRFEESVVREHARSDDQDPIFFGPNTSLWFKSLFQRDVGELGSDAIVTSGAMLWGRLQKTPVAQRKVEGWLRSIAERAKIEFKLQRPDPELWWHPVWSRAVKDPQATPEILAAILQEVRKDDLVQTWMENFLFDFHAPNRAFDVSQEIERLLKGPPISIGGRHRSRDERAGVDLGREAKRQRWDLVNQKLVEVYPDALVEEALPDCIARVAFLRNALNLRVNPPRILPKVSPLSSASSEWAPIVAQLKQVAHEFVNAGGVVQPPRVPPMGQGLPLGFPQANRRRVVPPLLPLSPETAAFHWAHCGFALTLLGDSVKASECSQKVRDLVAQAGARMTAEDEARVSDLKHGENTKLNLQGKPAEIVAEVQSGSWDAALSRLKDLLDPGERMEALAGLVEQYKNQSFRLSLEVGKIVTLGRASGNDLQCWDDAFVSSDHAKLHMKQGPNDAIEIVFQDVGSSNGSILESEIPVRLDPDQEYLIPRGGTVRLGMGSGTTIYNGLSAEARVGDEITLKRGLEPGEWLIQSRTLNEPVRPGWFQRLPKRDRASIPKELHDDIPDEKKFEDIVMTPRFHNMLNETASMVANPHRMAVRFSGPPGVGKTTVPEMIAAKMGVPYYRFVFSPRTDSSDVEGMWDFEMVPVLDDAGKPMMERDGVTPLVERKRVYREGVATIAMENGGHLVWDEPDLGRPGLLAFLNDISDPDEYVWVRKTDGKLIRIKVDSRYRCYVTENGREAHGNDFLRRFVPYYVGPWSEEETAQVLAERYETKGGKRHWSRKTTEVLAKIHDRLSFLASSYEDPITHAPMTPLGGTIQQTVEFTPRSILWLAERLIRSGPMTPETLSRAIRAEYILPLADPNDRAMVWQQIQPILEPIIQEKGWAADAIGPKAIPVPTVQDIEKKYLGGRKIPRDGFAWTQWALRVVDETLWNRALGKDVMWLGDAGIGKTRTPQQISKIQGVNHFKGKMSEETEEMDLIGMPGPNGFQKGLVTLAVEQGGNCHYDEALLLQQGRAESVFGPLMDGDQALLIKNPRRVLKRVPGKTFFMFTSNPYWGDFAGKGRHEQSPAIMSRMAVICMTGEFAMTEQDRLDIRMHEPPPAEVRVALPNPGKKKS